MPDGQIEVIQGAGHLAPLEARAAAAAAGDPSVVDHDHVAAITPGGWLACGGDLAAGAPLPCLNRGGIGSDAREQPPERAVAGFGSLATGGETTLIFAPGAVPGDASRTLICTCAQSFFARRLYCSRFP